VAIWTLVFDAGATITLPPAQPGSNRTLYFFSGRSITVGGRTIDEPRAIRVRADVELVLEAGPDETELLLLQGKPIDEPVAHYGPFVMNSTEQLRQAISDYQRTRFGGWPWPSDGPVHPRSEGRFAKHADGRVERRD
jgi:redox-sensitive bicupin YhaK (pirin superfamily)